MDLLTMTDRRNSGFAYGNDLAMRHRIYRSTVRENLVRRRRTSLAQNSRHAEEILSPLSISTSES